MTIYNHQNFLEQSIKSIIKQKFKNWELIACENGSKDKSPKLLKKFKDRRIKKYFFKKNIGRTNCLNFALKKSKGKYVAILDSDDIAFPLRLKRQFDYLEGEKDVALVGSWFSRIDTNNIVRQKIKYKITKKFIRHLLFFNLIGHSTIMFKKNIIKKIGIYPKKFKFMQDYAFFLKVYKKFKIEIMPFNLTNCRTHHKNSETVRVSKTLVIERENLKLLTWTKNNFNLNIFEQFYHYYSYIKICAKILLRNV